MSRRICVAFASAVLLSSCASSDDGGNRRDTMTQRQKDSVLGQSGLPGAQGVTKALRAADSMKARQARADSATQP